MVNPYTVPIKKKVDTQIWDSLQDILLNKKKQVGEQYTFYTIFVITQKKRINVYA